MLPSIRSFAIAVPVVAALVLSTGAAGPKKTVVDVAVENGQFTTLVAALKAAELVETLQGKGPFTVFAPNDEAFAKLPDGTVEALLADREKLTSILTYHVVPGAVKAEDVVKMKEAKTIQGQKVRIDATDGVRINDSKVILADVMASNGVIHVIDSVLMPPASKRFPSVSGDNLNGKTFNLPGDLEGETNLVLVAFHRWQQRDVDTWLAAAAGLEEKVDGFRYYEVPTISECYGIMRGWIDGGMRRGIPDEAQRGRTITLYIDKGPFKADLDVRTEKRIVALLLSPAGEILWRAEGRRTAEKMAGLERALGLRSQGSVAGDAVMRVFASAIDRGAPMYNQGNVDGCVGIYEVAIESVLTLSSDLPTGTRQGLEEGLRKARLTHDRSERAWVLRRAMDEAHEAMSTY
jgi:uncharacterized surface protein with fasciclin (FAS1) repeats